MSKSTGLPQAPDEPVSPDIPELTNDFEDLGPEVEAEDRALMDEQQK